MQVRSADKAEGAQERRRRRREERLTEARFEHAHRAERSYGASLRNYARQIARVLEHFADPETGIVPPERQPELGEAMRRYAAATAPWARATAARMVAEVNRRNLAAWQRHAEDMGAELRRQLLTAPIGEAVQALLDVAVGLITSLPGDAAARAQQASLEAVTTGSRYAERTPEVEAALARAHPDATARWLRSRATLIARTETARAASVLTQARAEHIGATGYVWRTSGDAFVRPSHKRLNGTAHRWDDPPLSDPPDHRSHPGQIWNCFPGDTIVDLSTGCRRLWRVPYDGQIVDFYIAGAKLFSATPNHPVLTDRGWRAAGQIDVGDYLVGVVKQAVEVIETDKDHVQPSFAQLFAALVASGCRSVVSRYMFDFHGDTPDGNVDCIPVDEFLPRDFVACVFETLGDRTLTDADRWIVVRAILHIAEALFPGGRDELFALIRVELAHADSVRRAGVSALDAMLAQHIRDRQTRAPVTVRQLEFAGAGGVCRDDRLFRQDETVVPGSGAARYLHAASPERLAEMASRNGDLSGGLDDRGSGLHQFFRVDDLIFRRFSGHVFTMQSVPGWYGITAANIATKNCRCYPEPILPEED